MVLVALVVAQLQVQLILKLLSAHFSFSIPQVQSLNLALKIGLSLSARN
jgi:hypothetical protein